MKKFLRFILGGIATILVGSASMLAQQTVPLPATALPGTVNTVACYYNSQYGTPVFYPCPSGPAFNPAIPGPLGNTTPNTAKFTTTTSKIVNGAAYSVNYPGSDLSARIAAATADAINGTNGSTACTVDLTGEGITNSTAQIDIGAVTMPSCKALDFIVPANLYNEVILTPVVFTASISGTTMTVSAVSSGVIFRGDPITGSGISAGTYIVSKGTGTGGTGTYTINNSQTVGSETVTAKEYAFYQYPNTNIICKGGVQQACRVANYSAANNLYALYGQDSPGYYLMKGITYANDAGSTFASGGMCLFQYGYDGSHFEDNQCFDDAPSDPSNTFAAKIGPNPNLGFHSIFLNNTFDSEWGATNLYIDMPASGPYQVAALSFISNTFNTHGPTASGNPSVVCHDAGGYSSIISFSGANYFEGQNAPMSAPWFRDDGCTSINFDGQQTVLPLSAGSTTSPFLEITTQTPTAQVHLGPTQFWGGDGVPSSNAWSLPAYGIKQDNVTIDCPSAPCLLAPSDSNGFMNGYDTGTKQFQNISVGGAANLSTTNTATLNVNSIKYVKSSVQGVTVLGLPAVPYIVGSAHVAANNSFPSTLATSSWTSITGNAEACWVSRSSSATISSVTDGTNTFTAVTSTTQANYSRTDGWFYSLNITGKTGAVTATASGGGITAIQCLEVANVLSTSALDITTSGTSTGGSSTAVTSSFTTTATPEIALVAMSQNAVSVTHTPGSGYTFLSTDAAGYSATEYQAFTTIQTGITASFTFSTTDAYIITAITLKGVLPIPLYTVSSGTGNPALPSASSVPPGTALTVTDATSISPGTCVGGSTHWVAAVSDGTNWNCP